MKKNKDKEDSSYIGEFFQGFIEVIGDILGTLADF